MKVKTALYLICFTALVMSCKKEEEPTPNENPTATITINGTSADTTVEEAAILDIVTTGSDSDGSVASTSITVDGVEVATASPYSWTAETGTHTIAVTITDDEGATATQSITVTVTAIPVDVIGADDANIQYSGRIDFTDATSPGFCHAGTSIKAQFSGDMIDVIIDDHSAGATNTTNYFYLILDDGAQDLVLEVNNTQTVYPAFRNLSAGTHTIEVFKRTECSVGLSNFEGFQVRSGESLSALPAKPTRKIEFIGDSQTVGYGNEASLSSSEATSGFTSINENNYKAWGAITSRNLDAQYMCVAYSGRGMYRNNTGATFGTLPLIYDKIYPDDGASPIWNTADYTPDVIVINLGTNDWAPEAWGTPSVVDSAQFVDTYISFVNTLRTYYPSAKIICATGVMMSDFWPPGAQAWTRIQQFTQVIVTELNNAGDNDVSYFNMSPQTEPYGEDWHPSAATHQTMATAITSEIQSIMGW